MHSPKNLRMVTEEYSTTPVSQRIFSQNLNMTMPIKSFDTQSTLEQSKTRNSILGDRKFKMKKFVNKMRDSIAGPKTEKKNMNMSMSIDFSRTARKQGSDESEDMRQVISILNDQI